MFNRHNGMKLYEEQRNTDVRRTFFDHVIGMWNSTCSSCFLLHSIMFVLYLVYEHNVLYCIVLYCMHFLSLSSS